MPDGMAWRDITLDLTPLRQSRQFRLLFTGSAASSLGSRVTDIAIPLQIYALTKSNLAVGLLGLVVMVPKLSLSLIGGAIADRVDRRRLILACEATGLTAAALLLVNARLAAPSLPLVYVLAFVIAAAHSVNAPANRSAVPLLIEPAMYTQAMAVKSLIYSGSWLLGPAVAGGAKAIGGLSLAFAIDIASYVVGIGAFGRMRPIPPIADAAEDHVSTLRSVTDGLRTLRGNQPLIGSFLQDFNAMLFGLPTALFPGLLDQRYDNSAVATALLYGAPFLGSMLASATSGWAPRVRRHGIVISGFVVAWGLAIAVFGLVRPLPLAVAALTVAGMADMYSGVFRQSMLMEATPPHMRGRMEGVGMAVWTGGPALGDLEAGVAARLTSTSTAIWSGGVLCALGSVAITALLPRYARYVAPSATSAPPVDEPPTAPDDVATAASG